MAIWEEPFNGRTWQQMPGSGPDEKKMNFALFRRGKLTLVDLEKWEDGETSAQKQRRKHWALAGEARKLQALRARAERMELDAIVIPGSRETGETPETNEPEESETMSTTTKQKQLLQRFQSIAADKGRGFKGRLAKRVPMSTATAATFFGGRPIGDEMVDRIQAALDDDSWQGDGAEPNGKPARRRRSQRKERSAPPRAHRDASAQVTIEELQKALQEHIAAKERFADLAKRYAVQLEN